MLKINDKKAKKHDKLFFVKSNLSFEKEKKPNLIRKKKLFFCATLILTFFSFPLLFFFFGMFVNQKKNEIFIENCSSVD